jgi:PPP family 3-phenylpropionic acid transporter
VRPRVPGDPRADPLYILFHALYWLGPGTFGPFYFPLLAARGVAPWQLGLLAAVTPLCALAVQPTVGWLCDRTGRARLVLCLLSLSSAGLLPLFAAVRGFGGELAVVVPFAIVNAPTAPLGDALTIAHLGSRASAYGRFRLWGSLSFAAAAAATGLLLRGGVLGLRGAFGLAAVFLALPGPLCLAFPTELRPRGAVGAASPAAPRLRALWRPDARPFLWFVALATAGTLAFNVQGTYFSVDVARLGGGALAQGLGWALPAAVEAPFFLMAAAIEERLGIRRTLLLAFGCEAAAVLAIALAPGPAAAVAGMTLQGPAFALFYGAAVPAVDRLVPAGLRASAQTLLWAGCFGFGAVLGNLGGSAAVAAMGLAGAYRALLACALGAALLFWTLGRRAIPDGGA